jgi:hypothetical protein
MKHILLKISPCQVAHINYQISITNQVQAFSDLSSNNQEVTEIDIMKYPHERKLKQNISLNFHMA